MRSFSSSSGSHSESDSSYKEVPRPGEAHGHRGGQNRLEVSSSSARSQPHHQLSSENIAKFTSRSAVISAPGFYAPSIRSQDFYIQEDVRPSRSPDGHSSRQHSSFGAISHCEATSSLSFSAKQTDLLDDLTHRTPHYGYTSDVTEQQGVVSAHATKIKDSASDSRFKQHDMNSNAKDSHSRPFREKVSSSTKSRAEAVPILSAPDLTADPNNHIVEAMLAAFERRIDKKIRNMNAALGSAPDSFTMLCTHPPAVNMFHKYVEEQQQMQEELQLIAQLSKTMAYEHKHQLAPGSIPIFSPQ